MFKKYSPVSSISCYSSAYVDVLNKSCGLPCIICDKDHVVSVAGIPKKELIERRISPMLEETMDMGVAIAHTDSTETPIKPVEGVDRYAVASGLITVDNVVCGSVIFLSGDQNVLATEFQIKLAEVSGTLLAKQLEE